MADRTPLPSTDGEWEDWENAGRKPVVGLIFEPRDLWLGVYWTFDEGPGYEVWHRADGSLSVGRSQPGDRQRTHRERDLLLYICLIPTLPVKVRIPWAEWIEP